jgi:hypothetical protein
MKSMALNVLLLIGMFYASSSLAEGRCVPGPLTQSWQAQFCNNVQESRRNDGKRRCNEVGCEWLEIAYRCVPGQFTDNIQAQYCHHVLDNERHCREVGCEWQGVYQQR